MPNTQLEANLRAIGDGARLEQLAVDLLNREDYNVDPTGVRGQDDGRDALLERSGSQGVLHCSAQSNDIEGKICDDAKSAATRPEEFDFFIFVTTTQMAGTKRDRLERELFEEYGWRIHIKDFARLRKDLMDPDNHDLAQEHLHVDPRNALADPKEAVQELYELQIGRLRDRQPPYGTLDDGPLVAVHVIPVESISDPPEMIATDLPNPPTFRSRSFGTRGYGDFVITAPHADFDDQVFSEYVYLDGDGWLEAATTRLTIDRSETPGIGWFVDREVVNLVSQICEMYQNCGIVPPFYVYVTLIDATEYPIEKPQEIWGPTATRPIGEDVFRLKCTKIEDFEDDVALALREPFYRLWNRTGWSNGSIHYSKSDDGGFEWDPYEP